MIFYFQVNRDVLQSALLELSPAFIRRIGELLFCSNGTLTGNILPVWANLQRFITINRGQLRGGLSAVIEC